MARAWAFRARSQHFSRLISSPTVRWCCQSHSQQPSVRFSPSIDVARWRRSTWVLIGLSVFWALLFVAWFIVPDSNPDEAAVLTARAVHFGIWTFGFAFSTLFWGIYRWFAIQSRQG